MKHIIAVVAILATTSLFSRLSAQQIVLAPVLNDYYNIKEALVAGDAKAAAEKATGFLKDMNGVDMHAIPMKDHMAFMALKDKLAADAQKISASTDISKQRESFAGLSANMASLAKQARLSDQPVYLEYCPMKKSSWLSSDSAIKNPYYGNSMLTCGKVTGTLKP